MLTSEAIKLMGSMGSGGIEYGIEWHSDTDTYYRLGGAVGKTAITGGTNDFDNIEPWKSIKRLLLLDNGNRNYYLDANDSTKKADGTTADLTGASGQAVVEIPKFYYKCVYPDANTFQFWICMTPKSGYEVIPSHFRDRNGDGTAEEVDYRYIGAFEGYYNSTTAKLESKISVVPKVSTTITNFRTYAQSRGTGWGIQDYFLTYAIQMLYLIEYAHFDSQTKIGKGYTSGGSVVTTGRTLSLGNKSGNESNIGTDGLHAVSYRGIENLWGNMNKLIDGLKIDASYNILLGNKSFNDAGTGYTSYTTNLSVAVSGYLSKTFQNKSIGFMPKEGNATSSTKLCDQGNLSSNCVAGYGGHYSNGSIGGAFAMIVSFTTTSTSSSLGSRLAY